MNDGQVQECIDYLRFSMELEGSSLAEGTEAVLRSVLEGERTVAEVHADFIRKEGLEVAYEAGYDEMSNYPDSKCLVNYFNIRDKKVLRPIEHFLVNLRTVELFMDPMPGRPTFSLLKEIHSRLFGDIYPSAGMIRTVEASKRKDFCRPQFIEKAADELFTRLSNDKYLCGIDDAGDFANDLAFYMGEAEALHPFKDGNGRATRLFFDRLVRQAGFRLRWAQADPDRMLEASIAAIDGDYQALVNVLEEILVLR
ncbi:MAG: Fic family protein [Spirochaetes bacterium]|uniref:protein adenylyltransferase n=1 Tax=Candidatus Aphodenecus pullistercoris TaxID=2840669 RepID=A0A9D9E742_9SPIR|nr:Fic family protein [Candidatus Aphodenecus pullistercoris]